MKKRFYILLLFISCFIGINAQPNPGSIPNPATGQTEWKVKYIYNVFDKMTSFSADGITISAFGNNGEGILLDGNGSAFLDMTIPLGSGSTKYNDLYFVYYGADDILNEVYSSWVKINVNNSATDLGGGWKLAHIDISALSDLVQLRFAKWGGQLYIANVYIVHDDTDGPKVPAPLPPSRPAGTYFSLYSDQTNYGNDVSWVATGGTQNIHYTTSKNDESKELTITPQSWGGNVKMYISENYKDIVTAGYTYLHFDIFYVDELTESDNTYIGLYNSDGDTNYKNIRKKLISNTSGGWTSVDLNLTEDLVPSWEFDRDDVLSTFKFISFYTDGQAFSGSKSFYIDNVYFYTPTEPDRAPSSAGLPAEDVIPIYGEYVTSPDYTWTFQSSFEDERDHNISANIELSTTDISILTPGSALSLTTGSGETANVLHIDIWVAQLSTNLQLTLNGSLSYTIPAGSLRIGRWNTLSLPLELFGLGITSINKIEFAGSGIIYADNVFFYYTLLNPFPVAKVYINGTQSGNPDGYMTINEAMQYVHTQNTTNQDIEIAIIRDSNEPSSVSINAENWNSLTFYASGEERTVTLTSVSDNKSLFKFEELAKNTIFNGRLDKTGAPLSLILQGKYLPSEPETNNFNSVIAGHALSNITIKDCKFKGQPDNRPEVVLNGSGNDIIIKDNYFEDCLYLGSTIKNSSNSIITVYSFESYNLGWEISGNHFYETEQIYFTSPIFRQFINITVADVSNNNSYPVPIKVTNNKIGGSGRSGGEITGTMRINSESAGVSSFVYPIQFISHWPNGDNYSLIEGNEIANIELINPTPGVWKYANDTYFWAENALGEFTGIVIIDGKVIIKNNKIHDITSKARPHSDPQGNYGYLNLGIRSEAYGGNGTFIIEGNEILNFQSDLLADASTQQGQVSGINSRFEGSTKGIIRDNRIIIGHSGTKKMNAALTCVSLTIENVNSSSYSQSDIHNNICVISEYSMAGFYNVTPISIANFVNDNNGVINCFNNIFYVQPRSNGSFNNADTRIAGISHTAAAGTTNIFHNTVVLNDLKSSAGAIVPTAFSFYYRNDQSNLNLWNNNFVNLNNNGLIFSTDNNVAANIYSDYNNYYVLSGGNFFEYTSVLHNSFDNWKFSNPVPDLTAVELDHHSRFLNPLFANTGEVALTIAGIETLRSNLVPSRFLGGTKTADSILVLSGIAEESAVNKDAANIDFRTTPSVRRQYLPTIGALNTSFSNYWNGTVSTDWNTPGNWQQGYIPGKDAGYIDVVFNENTSDNLLLDAPRTIHDIYNDSQKSLDLNGQNLTVTGYIGQENNKSTIIASSNQSTIIYNGLGNGDISGTIATGSAAQHIFKNTFLDNKVNNITLNNNSEYFVLLHGELTAEPAGPTLDILNDFSILNPDETLVTYPNGNQGIHAGGLNCTWNKTQLRFSGDLSANVPDLSITQSAGNTYDAAYRPYIGQRIPRHGIFNNEVYDLTDNSNNLTTYHDYLNVKNNLTINSDKIFNIAADKYVKVDGLTNNNAGVSGLVIKSRELSDDDEFALKGYIFPTMNNATDKAKIRPNATFIFSNQTSDPVVPATVEMYSLAAIDKNGVGEYIERWQYFTPAVRSANRSDFTGVKDIAKWNPQGNIYDPYVGSPYWRWIDNGTLTAGDGYTLTQNAPIIYDLKGNLANADYAQPMTYYVYPKEEVDAGAAGLGWRWPDQLPNNGKYVFGNPFTAALDITQLDFGPELEETVYIYNTGHNNDWLEQGGQGTVFGENPGQNIIVPKNWAGKKIDISTGLEDNTNGIFIPRYISSMQGFTVCFDEGKNPQDKTTTSSFTMEYNATSVNPTIGKNEEALRSDIPEPERAYMLVKLQKGNEFDEVLLSIHPDCKKGFDNGWDGRTEVNEEEKNQLFTIEEEKSRPLKDSYYKISTMNDINNTWLGITTDEARAEYKLLFYYTDMDLFYQKILLEDTFLGTVIDITANGKSYSFVSDQAGQINKRFRILTDAGSGSSIDSPETASLLNIYSSGNTIYVDNKGESGLIYIYDTTGRCLLTNSFNAGSKTEIHTDLKPGVYITVSKSGNSTVNQMIILR